MGVDYRGDTCEQERDGEGEKGLRKGRGEAGSLQITCNNKRYITFVIFGLYASESVNHKGACHKSRI